MHRDKQAGNRSEQSQQRLRKTDGVLGVLTRPTLKCCRCLQAERSGGLRWDTESSVSSHQGGGGVFVGGLDRKSRKGDGGGVRGPGRGLERCCCFVQVKTPAVKSCTYNCLSGLYWKPL